MAVIRRAVPADAASLAALAESTFRETFAAENSQENVDLHCTRSFGAGKQGEEIADPQLITFLAEVDGNLVGFAQLRLAHSANGISGAKPAELHRIYVGREWHGRGVAQELMREVTAAAVREHADCVWLGVWERNPKAIAFYRKHGFRIVGDHSFMLGEDRQRDLVLAARVEDLSTIALH
jgi:ribosomal protein S18 acetylase RimI-like enzyme